MFVDANIKAQVQFGIRREQGSKLRPNNVERVEKMAKVVKYIIHLGAFGDGIVES